MDRSALLLPTIFVSGGKRGLEIEVAAQALIDLLDANPADIAR